MKRIRFLLVGVAFILALAIGRSAEVPLQPAMPEDRAYDPPPPSPIPGLHDYAQPTRHVAVTEGIPVPTATPTPRRRKATSRTSSASAVGHRSVRVGRDAISGIASWHATGRDGNYAAACRPLRRALGRGWRGSLVLVAYRQRAIEVRLNDWCGSHTKLIDLSDEAFRYLSNDHLSRGVLRVAVDPR